MERYSVRVGLLVEGEELAPRRSACIHVSNGIIESIESTATCPTHAIGSDSLVALPQPGIAHAHSGDHLFPEAGFNMDLDSLVSPPDGLKHRLLAKAGFQELVEGILDYYTLAWKLGVGLLVDFREGGGLGCLAAKRALEAAPQGISVVVLGRPGPRFPEGCDGLGLSSPLDYDREEVERLASTLKPAMTHVAETPAVREAGDLEIALEAGFDALVHGTFLSKSDLERLAEEGVALIACPRSNMWHGLGLPPIFEALRLGVPLALGTDNAAWTTPNPWREAETALLVARAQGAPQGEWLAKKILEAVFIEPYRLVGERPRVIEEGKPARLLVAEAEGLGLGREHSVYYWLVKRIGGENLRARIDDGVVSWL